MSRFGRTTARPGGKLVVERARTALFEVRALDRDVKLFNNHDLGEVRFGIGPIPAAVLLSEAVAALTPSHPNLSVRVRVDDPATLTERLYVETIDFMVTVGSSVAPSSDLNIELLPSRQCGWFVRPDHPIFGKGRRRISMLRELQMASVPAPEPVRESLRRLMQHKPFESAAFAVKCNSFHVLKELARDSDTVICGPFAAVRQELATGAPRNIDFKELKDFTTRFAIVSLAHRTLSPGAAKTIGTIVECERRLEDS